MVKLIDLNDQFSNHDSRTLFDISNDFGLVLFDDAMCHGGPSILVPLTSLVVTESLQMQSENRGISIPLSISEKCIPSDVL